MRLLQGREFVAARALAQLSVRELAAIASISPTTLTKIEKADSVVIGEGRRPVGAFDGETVQRVIDALAVHGVEFLPKTVGCRAVLEK